MTRDEVYGSASAFRGFLDSDWSGTGFTLDLELGDYRLQTITGADSIDYRRYQDFEGTPLEHLHIDYNTEIDAWSQEVRFFYEGSDTLSWVLGASYAEDELHEDTLLYGAQGVLPLIFGGAVFSPQVYDQETEAFALYGHAEWRFADAWNLVSELRYTDEDKSFVGGARLGFANGATVPFVSTDDSISFDAWSGKIGLEWSLTDDLLTYAMISRGFKTGGFFGGFPTNVAQLAPFDAETLWGLELGVKSDLADGRVRLNASLFSYDREDVQQNAGDPTSPIQIKRITNIGDVDTVGAEAEVTWLATDALVAEPRCRRDRRGGQRQHLHPSGLAAVLARYADGGQQPAELLGSQRELRRPLRRLVRREPRLVRAARRALSVGAGPEHHHESRRSAGVPRARLLAVERAFRRRPASAWAAQLYVNNASDETYRVLARNDGAFGIHELYGMPRTAGVSFQYQWE